MVSVDYLQTLIVNPHVWKKTRMQDPITTYITPVTKDGKPDQWFDASIIRILDELGEGTIEELRQFARETAQTQRRAASAGLRLAKAVFHEAAYLDKNHRFDDDNKFGWRSKALRKQAQQILEQIGFKQKNAHKLVVAAAWLTAQHFSKEELRWLDSLTPSHIYELTRMNTEGYSRVKQQVTYPGFTFSAGQQEISVRALEKLRSQYPSKAVVQAKEPTAIQIERSGQDNELQSVCGTKGLDEFSQVVPNAVHQLQAATDTTDVSNAELVEQFTLLVQMIDWSAVGTDPTSHQLLSSIQDSLGFIADIYHEMSCPAGI
jgi:hypothetical protein